MRRAGILLLLAACSRGAPAPPEPSPAPASAPLTRAPGDAPLPAPDEVPDFLRERGGAPAEAIAEPSSAPVDAPAPPPEGREPTLAELMQQVQEGDAGDDSFAYVTPSASAPAVAPEPERTAQPGPAAQEPAAHEPEAQVAAAAADPCAGVQARIAVRRDYLQRTAEERNRFAYVPDAADASALRLLESLRRCKEHPDDPDCQAPAVERDADELAAAPGTVEREPDDLTAGDAPDDVVHDPALLTLLRELESCRRRQVAQPLLER